jgi:hypothetical protein
MQQGKGEQPLVEKDDEETIVKALEERMAALEKDMTVLKGQMGALSTACGGEHVRNIAGKVLQYYALQLQPDAGPGRSSGFQELARNNSADLEAFTRAYNEKAVVGTTAHELAIMFDAVIDVSSEDVHFLTESVLAQEVEQSLKLLAAHPKLAEMLKQEQLVLENYNLIKQQSGLNAIQQ